MINAINWNILKCLLILYDPLHITVSRCFFLIYSNCCGAWKADRLICSQSFVAASYCNPQCISPDIATMGSGDAASTCINHARLRLMWTFFKPHTNRIKTKPPSTWSMNPTQVTITLRLEALSASIPKRQNETNEASATAATGHLVSPKNLLQLESIIQGMDWKEGIWSCFHLWSHTHSHMYYNIYILYLLMSHVFSICFPVWKH